MAAPPLLRPRRRADGPLHPQDALHAAFTGSTSCPECGLDPATIVDGEAIGLVAEPEAARVPAAPSAPAKRAGRPTKADLEARVRELEAEIERLREG
jgi:hypothetical protein